MQNKSSSKQRIIAIDILKVFAVIVVLNSHMEICYGDYAFLATGGAIGDALFFFCSGFMLFRKEPVRFDNFYKKRIARIYPAVLITAVFAALVFSERRDILSVFKYSGGWFVNCIMIYYVAIWIIHRFFINRINIIWGMLFAVILIWFYFGFEYGEGVTMYGNNYFKWAFFFLFMLQGAIMGRNLKNYHYTKATIPMLAISIVSWYGMLIAANYLPWINDFQLISLIPLAGVTYYFYKLCCADFWKKLYAHPVGGQLIFIVGGLCLECYLIQFYLFTDKLNWIFPLNIPLIMLIVLTVAYILNFLSNVFVQIFQHNDFDWRNTFLYKKNNI